MKNDSLKKAKPSKFKYFLTPLLLLSISVIFFMLAYIDRIAYIDINSSDVGFGYAASGVISLLLSLISSIIISFFYKKLKKH